MMVRRKSPVLVVIIGNSAKSQTQINGKE